MSLPGSKLSASRNAAAKSIVKDGASAKRANSSDLLPITVLSKPTKVVVPAPKITTFAAPNAVVVSRSVKKPVKVSATASQVNGFKRPASLPRPVEKPVQKPAQKSVEKPVEIPISTSVMLDMETSAKPVKKYAIAKRKVWAGLAFAGFALAITGFLVYLNLPDISVRVRATELGISTNLPAFKPDGYSVQGIAEIENDVLTVRYASSDDSYVFTARKSALDPYQMADYAKSILPEAESVFGNGLTVYIQGSDAVWANGGVLYTITGSSLLEHGQIVKIAIATE
ncbi:hypothetical protein FWG86_00570 [Candidatus Saccharibacteria bacterium]|nr:hypothetical protein [Candidatus Saccharibacteria bacterium]